MELLIDTTKVYSSAEPKLYDYLFYHVETYQLMCFPGDPEGKVSAKQETCVRSLDWDYPLGKGMATHSSILAWKISRTEGPGRLQSMGSQRVGHN